LLALGDRTSALAVALENAFLALRWDAASETMYNDLNMNWTKDSGE
jgi:hypothetical protein